MQIIQIERLVRYLDLCLGRAAPANSDEISYLQFCVQSTVTTEQAFQTLSRNMGVRISVAVLAGVFLVVGALVAFKVPCDSFIVFDLIHTGIPRVWMVNLALPRRGYQETQSTAEIPSLYPPHQAQRLLFCMSAYAFSSNPSRLV